MTSPFPGSDNQILPCARRNAALVADYQIADRGTQESLRPLKKLLLEKARSEIEAEKSGRQSFLVPNVRCFVQDRKPFNRPSCASEAEAVRY